MEDRMKADLEMNVKRLGELEEQKRNLEVMLRAIVAEMTGREAVIAYIQSYNKGNNNAS